MSAAWTKVCVCVCVIAYVVIWVCGRVNLRIDILIHRTRTHTHTLCSRVHVACERASVYVACVCVCARIISFCSNVCRVTTSTGLLCKKSSVFFVGQNINSYINGLWWCLALLLIYKYFVFIVFIFIKRLHSWNRILFLSAYKNREALRSCFNLKKWFAESHRMLEGNKMQCAGLILSVQRQQYRPERQRT